jgi:LacI family transcriptional regulator/LacI family purine nucleotide synthesis repressor
MRRSILDVAVRAGVSKSTVSRVLNNQPHVNSATREKVHQAIREMDFQPNAHARSIVSGRTQTVGLLVPNLHSPFYVEIVEGIVDEISSREYGLLLYKSEGKDERLLKRVLHRGTIDGIIAITPRFKEQSFIDAFGREVPFLLINHRNTEIDAPYVCFDNFAGGVMAGKFLADLGHRRIACFTGRLENPSTRDRFEGFRQALASAGLSLEDPWLRVKGLHYEDSVDKCIREWMRRGRLPTAVFAYSDLTALEVIAVLREGGLSVPDDVSVLGFDDIRMARYSRPPLTTISQSMEVIGRSGAGMLLRMIEGEPENPKTLTIEPRMVVRDSCGEPTGAGCSRPRGGASTDDPE